jgi:hypothetical protein
LPAPKREKQSSKSYDDYLAHFDFVVKGIRSAGAESMEIAMLLLTVVGLGLAGVQQEGGFDGAHCTF